MNYRSYINISPSHRINVEAHLSAGDTARSNNASAMTRLRAICNDGSLDVTNLTVRGRRTVETEITLKYSNQYVNYMIV